MPAPMPLAGVRVIDLTHHAAGPFCTRMLGDYGADVIKVEPPGGDIARTLPPFYHDEPGPERSALFMFLNTNKRSVVLDLKADAGRVQLLGLARGADALVENFSPGTLERLGLGYDVLHAANPRLVVTSISNFGQDGPYRDYHGVDLTLYGYRLQEAGIPAGVVMNEADAYNDVQHAARGFWQRIEHPETGTQRHVGRAWRASGTPQVLPRHAPLLGQDNEYVYRELLGFSAAEYDRFVAEGHAGTAYEPSVQWPRAPVPHGVRWGRSGGRER